MSDSKKNKILLLSFLSSLWVCYILAISPTLALKKEAKFLEKNHLQNQETLLELNRLILQKKQYEQILKTYPVYKTSSLQNNLLETIHTFGKKQQLKIVSFHQPHSAVFKNTLFTTYSFEVKGSYQSMVKLIQHLEEKRLFGTVFSCRFEKKKNYRTNKSFLVCTLFLQHAEQTEISMP